MKHDTEALKPRLSLMIGQGGGDPHMALLAIQSARYEGMTGIQAAELVTYVHECVASGNYYRTYSEFYAAEVGTPNKLRMERLTNLTTLLEVRIWRAMCRTDRDEMARLDVRLLAVDAAFEACVRIERRTPRPIGSPN
jgi:hypothetical protein